MAVLSHDPKQEIKLDISGAYKLAREAISVFIQIVLKRYHLPRDLAMRTYLIANVVLYGARGLELLFFSASLAAYQKHFLLVSSWPAQVIWAMTGLTVATCNALCIPRRSLRLWQISAVLTTVYAASWATTVTILALEYGGDVSLPFIWSFIVCVHFLMIRNRFVSVRDEEKVLKRYEATIAGLPPYITDHPLLRRLEDVSSDSNHNLSFDNPDGSDHHGIRHPETSG